MGDAAHATSPHHGAGAGLCIEDAAVLASLLSHKEVTDLTTLEASISTYANCRKARGDWLVQSSRLIGDAYECQALDIGADFAKIEREINLRNGIIANVDVDGFCNSACKDLEELLRGQGQ